MKFKKYLFWTVASLLILGALFLTAVFFRFKAWTSDPEPAQKLASYFSRITKSDFQYSGLQWRLLPFPMVRFSEPVFRFKSDLKHELKADSLELHFDLGKLVFGEFGFSKLRLRQGLWQGQVEAPKGLHNFSVEQIDLKTSALSSDRPVKFYMSGDTGGRRKAVIIHGELKLPPLEEKDLNSLGFQVQVLTRNFRFRGSPEWEFLGWIPSSGPSDFLIVLRRDPMNDRILFSGDAGLRELVFKEAADETASPRIYQAGAAQVKYAGHFSPSTDELKFTQCAFSLPFSQFNLQGTYLPHRREFRALTFNFIDVKLDDLLAYVPGLKNKVPYFIGFSGLADLSVSVNGFANRLKIYGDFNLTKTLFTYGRFFQKPKEKPFRIKTDFDWAGQVLSGEYSGNFEGLNFKGSLMEWKPSGETKVNLITNAFAAEQLTGYIPFLTDYEFGGTAKVFADLKGNFQSPAPPERMFHITLQDGRILRKGTGSGFKDLNFSLDFGPMQMEAKDFRFSLGGSSFSVELTGLHPEKNPKWDGSLKSEKITAGPVWKEWTDFWGGAQAEWLENQHTWVQRLILSQDPFEAFEMKAALSGGVLEISALNMRAFEGAFAGKAQSQMEGKTRKTTIQMSGSEMNAETFFKFAGAENLGLQGKMDWETSLEGVRGEEDSSTKWDGPFSVSIEKGTLKQFDYVRALKEVEPFKKPALSTEDQPLTFDTFDLKGRVEDKRIKVSEMQLIGDRLHLDGEGEIDHEGLFNFRLKTAIEAGYFRELFPKHADVFVTAEDAFFGPVTLLAVGSAEELELKPDPQTVSELASYYARRKAESFTRYL